LSPFLSMWCYVRITYAECSLPSVRSLPNKPCELLPASKDFFSSVCSTVTCNHVVLLTCTNPLQGVGFPLPPRCTASVQRTSPWARPARYCRWCSATHPSARDRGGGGSMQTPGTGLLLPYIMCDPWGRFRISVLRSTTLWPPGTCVRWWPLARVADHTPSAVTCPRKKVGHRQAG